MTDSILTEDIAIAALRNFFRDKPFLFFGSGMSCALDPRFGVPALRDALVDGIRHRTLTVQQKAEWGDVAAALGTGKDLESALDAANDEGLLRALTEIAGSFIAGLDRDFAYRIAEGSAEWPPTRLVKRLVNTLPEGDRVLHALTPNYDMLFENACDFERIDYANGFFGGIERRSEWNAVERALLVPEQVHQRGRLTTVYKHRKHVRLYKVHGSLNYFFHHDSVIENSAWMWNPPESAQRVLITPGLSKYQTLQRYRQELLQTADAAISKATRFLFLGYGFNDSHLDVYIKRKLITQGCNGLIVTRDSNDRIESLLAQSSNLWLVCKVNDPSTDDTWIINRQYSNALRLPARRLWDVRNFTTDVLGG